VAVATVLAASFSRQAASSELVERARAQKETAIGHVRRSQEPDADRARESELALQALTAAKALLELVPAPTPDVQSEVEEVNALLYWVKKTMPLPRSALAADVVERSSREESDDVLDARARELFERAEQYARRNPDAHFMAAVRFFEVADRFRGTRASLDAQRLSLDHMRLAFRSDTAAASAAAAGPDRATALADLQRTLSSPVTPDASKLAACDQFLASFPGDGLTAEVLSARAVLAAGSPAVRLRAAREHVRAHDAGVLAGFLKWATGLATEADGFDAVLQALRTNLPAEEKARLCRAYVDKFPGGTMAPEVRSLASAFDARSSVEATNAWLAYVVAFPQGVLRDAAVTALRQSDTLVMVQVRQGILSDDEERVRRLLRVYAEIQPAGRVGAETKSLAEVWSADAGAARAAAAERHLAAFPRGSVSEALAGTVARWKLAREEEAFRGLTAAFALAPSEAAGACDAFLAKHPSGAHAREVSDARSALVGSQATRLAAARRYLDSYPAGAFTAAMRAVEKSLLAGEDERAWDSVAATLASPAKPVEAKLAACRDYLAARPDGAHAADARAGVERLLAALRDEEAAHATLLQALEAAPSPKDGVALCERFLATYPQGAKAAQVAARRDDFGALLAQGREDFDWQFLSRKLVGPGQTRLSGIEACLGFLKTYPSGAHRRDVVTHLGRLASARLGPHASRVRAAAFSPDAGFLVTVDADASTGGTGVWVWHTSTDLLAARYAAKPGFSAAPAATFLSEREVVLGEERGRVALWDVVSGQVEARRWLGLGEARHASALRGALLVGLAGDGAVRTWSPSSWRPDGPAFTCGGGLSAAGAGGDIIAAGTAKGVVLAFRSGAPEPLWKAGSAHSGAVDFAAVSPDGRRVATASTADGVVALRNASTGSVVWTARETCAGLAFAGRDFVVTGPALLRARDGARAAGLSAAPGSDRGVVAASPDGRFALTASGTDAVLWYVPALDTGTQ
jgi:hypothetical protein